MLDEGLFEIAAEQWTKWGVTFEQFHKGVQLWSTNQRPSLRPLFSPRAMMTAYVAAMNASPMSSCRIATRQVKRGPNGSRSLK